MSITVVTSVGNFRWPVVIERRSDGGYEVNARSTQFAIYVHRSGDGNYVVSIPQMRRCGSVPLACRGVDIAKYCDVENRVDAATIAAAVKVIIADQRKGGDGK